MTDSKSLGEQNYAPFAHRYAQYAETKPHNAYYDRPATLSLLPDVAGKRVLDAGCGPGIYAEWLVDHGAQVVAFDVTPD
ncbi:MAG: methyltransferase domain-containing protein, partial [Anaerolineae bacterium]|nr:methyltransferase domain-containing protein [Anaerolineae bacterium]